tara:strand:+ start:639 stop:1328 length:690 start_codon:yes stop_codon:yes gene_type:complete
LTLVTQADLLLAAQLIKQQEAICFGNKPRPSAGSGSAPGSAPRWLVPEAMTVTPPAESAPPPRIITCPQCHKSFNLNKTIAKVDNGIVYCTSERCGAPICEYAAMAATTAAPLAANTPQPAAGSPEMLIPTQLPIMSGQSSVIRARTTVEGEEVQSGGCQILRPLLSTFRRREPKTPANRPSAANRTSGGSSGRASSGYANAFPIPDSASDPFPSASNLYCASQRIPPP